MSRRSAVHSFVHDGYELAYEVYGDGPNVVVYMNGLLLDAGINRGIARRLAQVGNRVVLLDLLGHGRSDRPRRAAAHRIDFYARQSIGLLDHLGIERAVLGGVSLGAMAALSAGAQAPERIEALLLEMPVLETAAPFAALLFTPVLLGMTYGGPVARLGTGLMRALPRTGVDALDSFLDAGSMHPEEISSILHGTLMGALGPTEEERKAMDIPTLIIGHDGDPLHPGDDARRLSRQMPNATMVEAYSIAEMRLRPGRLVDEMIRFLDATWMAGSGVSRAG
ncbi:alpha/beta fold hydrolase [Euzebya tangerina]|uniref:alpha/beta fold hydrolase n=1 Tax=Euzebya tangerina TaxID=591198 RepID=UPI000E3201E2|nr:alpha/beta hydrolase [Euzebya tangerina]